MKVAGKVTPRLRRRIEELFDAGESQRAIAKRLAVEMSDPPSRSTIQSLLEGRQRPDGAPAATSVTHTAPKRSLEAPESDGDGSEGYLEGSDDAEDDPEPARARAPKLPDDASPAAWAIWSRLKAVGAKIDALEADVSAGRYPATQWAALIKVETTLARDLADQIPPPPPDPAKDPTNIAARAMVHQQVLLLLHAGAERHGRVCAVCRKAATHG